LLVKEAKATFKAMPGFILITPQQIHVVQSDVDQLAIMRNYVELDRASQKVSLQENQPSAYLLWWYGLSSSRRCCCRRIIFYKMKKKTCHPPHLLC